MLICSDFATSIEQSAPKETRAMQCSLPCHHAAVPPHLKDFVDLVLAHAAVVQRVGQSGQKRVLEPLAKHAVHATAVSLLKFVPQRMDNLMRDQSAAVARRPRGRRAGGRAGGKHQHQVNLDHFLSHRVICAYSLCCSSPCPLFIPSLTQRLIPVAPRHSSVVSLVHPLEPPTLNLQP